MKKRYVYMDLLNVIAIIAVIMTHSTTLFSVRPFSEHSMFWILLLIIQVILMVLGVPMLFMISGANLLDYRSKYTSTTFFKKRWLKAVVPLVFWSIIYFIFNHILFGDKLSLSEFIGKFLNNSINTTFWFLYVIIGFYIVLPIFSLMAHENNRRLIFYAAAVYFVSSGLIGSYYSIYRGGNFANGANMPLLLHALPALTGWLPICYLFAGYLIHTGNLDVRKRLCIYVGGIAGFLVTMIIAVTTSLHSGTLLNAGIFSQAGGVIVISVAVFTFVKNWLGDWNPSPHVQKVLRELSSCSLGIYIVHFGVLQVIYRMYGTFSLFSGTIIIPVVIYFSALVVVYLLKRIPLISIIVP
ncbi:acyltransferase [Leuconostoc falkenbergense]|uniref:acyltransferase n=1 Tax=Leuconostoc falkenbergense TaxID=2766470 RepID=UPI003BB1A173